MAGRERRADEESSIIVAYPTLVALSSVAARNLGKLTQSEAAGKTVRCRNRQAP